MDSCNSGSMQSSSGGDEEYDSRADSISAFFNTPGTLAALSHHQHQPTRLPTTTSLHHHHPPPPSFFDPLSPYFDAFPRSPLPPSNSNPLLNLDLPSSCTDVLALMGSQPPPPSTTPIHDPVGPGRAIYGTGPLPLSPSPPPLQHPPAPTGAAPPPRSSKKRSRASRRASTTVLTTDTSNFRAMVQEFTGLPAPPFSSSPFPRTRFDLFHGAASSSHYLLMKPFPVLSSNNPLAFAGSSPSSSSFPPPINSTATTMTSTTNVTTPTTATATATATVIAAAAAAATSSSITSVTAYNTSSPTTRVSTNTATSSNYQLPSDLGIGNQGQSLLNMFSYPSHHHPSPSTKYNSANVPILGDGKPPPPMMPSALATAAAAVGDYTVGGGGLGHGHADVRSSTIQSLPEPIGMPSSRGGGSGGGDDLLRWVEGPGGSDGGDQGQFRPAGGSCTGSQRGNNTCKLNYSGSGPSECHADKGSENVPARGEGMLDSWICSSD